MTADRIVFWRSAVRRTALALSLLVSWRLLIMMAQFGASSEWARRPWPTLLMAACLGFFVFGRRTLRAGFLLCVLFLAADVAGNNPPGREHAHLIPIAALFAYVLTAILKGTTPAAEEACWQSCRAVIGGAYTLAGIAKLSQSGLGWINDYYLRLLALNEASWSVGYLRDVRLWISDSPRLSLAASVYALIVELSGLALLSKRWRPYYTAALMLLHLQIFLGMNILWPDQLLLVLSLGLPWERLSAWKKTA